MPPVILITGAGGFIGTWVVRQALKQGLHPVAFDLGPRPPRWDRIIGPKGTRVPYLQGSLLDRQTLSQALDHHNVTHVIHLAALLTPACQSDPWAGAQVNLLGSIAVFEEVRLRAHRIKAISYASSVAVFGDASAAPSADSVHSAPPTFYGVFKKALEEIAQQYWRHFQIASTGIRPQVAYGPERDQGLTAGPSLAARAAAFKEDYIIPYIGCVGYDYVEDIASAFLRSALDSPPGAQVVDLPGPRATVEEIIAILDNLVPGSAARLSAAGLPIPAHAPPRPCFISSLFPEWKTTSLADGLRRTVDFYLSSAA